VGRKNWHEAVVTLLLARDGVNPNFKDEDGLTPLLLAASREHEAVVELPEPRRRVHLDYCFWQWVKPTSMKRMTVRTSLPFALNFVRDALTFFERIDDRCRD
jgi:hypothetical protein